MARIRRMREILFDKIMEDQTLKIYDSYFQISVVPSKETFSGKHDSKIMISCGMRYNDEKAKAFFDSDNPLKEQIINRLSKQIGVTQENIIKSHKTGRLKDLLIEGVALQVRALGIPVVLLKKEARFEIYEYVKTSNIDEILNMLYAMMIALGKAIKTFSEDPNNELTYYKILLKKNLDKFVDRGFSK